MNVFVLCTGRCGSTTFVEACKHIDNYTAGHETMFGRPGTERFGHSGYKDRHIEADTMMAWFLGPLCNRYGPDAYYVHLWREEKACAASLMRLLGRGGFAAGYVRTQFYSNTPPKGSMIESCNIMCLDYVRTVNASIECFLRTHPLDMQVRINIDNPHLGFMQMWNEIGAKGNLGAALREFNVRYNASEVSDVP